MALPGTKAPEVAISAATRIPRPTVRRWFMTRIVGKGAGTGPKHSARGPVQSSQPEPHRPGNGIASAERAPEFGPTG